MEKQKPEKKRSIAVVIALIWIGLWSGLLFVVGYTSLVQIYYFPIGTLFAIIIPVIALAICYYLTAKFIWPLLIELWKGKEKEEKK